MARERISLVSEEVKSQATLEARIQSGEINQENFNELTPAEQAQVNELLFKMASEKIEPNQGLSAIEFILIGHLRVMSKKINGLALTPDEQSIEESLNNILDMHQLGNPAVAKSDWLFDYMGYAEVKAGEFLQNRKEHIERKAHITGKA
jgi:hypothetical protein